MALVVTGCTNQTSGVSSPSKKSPDPLAGLPSIPAQTSAPQRTLKIKLTLDSPSDLKVTKGQPLKKDQVISDRAAARNKLMSQRQSLMVKIQQGQTQSLGSEVITATSYADEEAKIQAAQVKVDEIKAQITAYRASLPYTEAAWQQLPLKRERARLGEFQSQLKQAQADLNAAVADLQSAQERQQLATQQLKQSASLEQTQLLTQLNDIEAKLAGLAVIRAPMSGMVQDVKFLEQEDQKLKVEVILAMTDTDTNDASILASPNRTTSQSESVSVLEVIDGATLRVKQGNQETRLQLACVYAPDISQPLGKGSQKSLQSLLSRSNNQIKLQVLNQSSGLAVADAYTADGKYIQAEQAKAGWVYFYQTNPAECPNSQQLMSAQTTARQQRQGLWAKSAQPQ